MVVNSLVFTSVLMRAMLIAMASLVIITGLGLAYPILRPRTTRPSNVTDEGADLRNTITLGSKEMERYIESVRDKGNFNDGILMGYAALRNTLPKMQSLTMNIELTEFEILEMTLNESREFRNVSPLILQVYQHYEKVRFGSGSDQTEFESMVNLLESIYKLNIVLRVRAKSVGDIN